MRVSQGVLGSFRRFTRSTINTDHTFELKYTECMGCKQPLRADHFVHCKRCDNVFHNLCTNGAAEQPFQLRGDKFCDNSGEPIACPTCSVGGMADAKHLQATVEVVDEPTFRFKACFDLGTDHLKASTMLTSPNDRRDPSFVELSTVPTSCFWIDSDTFFVDVESGGPPGLTDKAVKFEPIKKILYDKPTQDAIRQLDGQGPEHVLEAIFLLSLKHLSFERSSQLTEWADAAAEAINTTGQHCVEISLFMATPAGLQVYEKVPLETALLRAGRSFAASWKLQACRPRVHIISEPEAALASVWGEETWSQEENSDSAIMIIDCGGTTMVCLKFCFPAAQS
ncbi:hypothetical protein HBI81_260180 [Parastagonospora nodorum]|nr:hypothetical protein HBI18_251920 [Parastagonospora nodorum]KAH6510371.1 hypothetical protein HBI81_260180 [Parastagonospora nodorum]